MLIPTAPLLLRVEEPKAGAAAARSTVTALTSYVPCFYAASSGGIHTGHNDGRAGGNGIWRPAAEPATAEEIQLQPAGRCQRACSDD